VKPFAADLAAYMTEQEAAREIQLMQLSYNKIHRTGECGVDVLNELLREQVK
jgi:hypothetical protein